MHFLLDADQLLDMSVGLYQLEIDFQQLKKWKWHYFVTVVALMLKYVIFFNNFYLAFTSDLFILLWLWPRNRSPKKECFSGLTCGSFGLSRNLNRAQRIRSIYWKLSTHIDVFCIVSDIKYQRLFKKRQKKETYLKHTN